jgi:hypothetical protein
MDVAKLGIMFNLQTVGSKIPRFLNTHEAKVKNISHPYTTYEQEVTTQCFETDIFVADI